MAFSPDGGTLASGSDDGTVLLWEIFNDIRTPTVLLKRSGDTQTGYPGEALENPIIVEVQDDKSSGLEGVEVTFSITKGGGALSQTTVTTDADGRAQTTLTLGADAGTNTVSATVAEIPSPGDLYCRRRPNTHHTAKNLRR